jgi:hypothetical protein
MTTIQLTNPSIAAAQRARQLCDHCGGPFGMVTHRWWGSKFCRRRCKEAHIREAMLNGRMTILRLCGFARASCSAGRPLRWCLGAHGIAPGDRAHLFVPRLAYYFVPPRFKVGIPVLRSALRPSSRTHTLDKCTAEQAEL